jgi:putative transposon-encoded protein
MKEFEIKLKGYELLNKTVTDSGTSGKVYVPKAWIGKKVQVLLIEPVNQKGE